MQALTAVIMAAFVAYAGAWYTGRVEGNFALLLLLATLVTGLYWLAERFYFLPQRKKAVAELEAHETQRRADLASQGITQVDNPTQEAAQRILMQPWWLDWTAGLFPVIITVFFLRSFLFEPFKIPSGSMIPTLMIGDLILVNKFHYGIRLPVIHTKISEGTPPQRGDVMVFRYPPNPNVDYIKRVVGVPGDTVAYLNKRLTVNGVLVPTASIEDFLDKGASQYHSQLEETFGDIKHRVLNDAGHPGLINPMLEFQKFRENCSYTAEGVTCKVPAGHYFMMGDNRDNSLDSRYWGFVPDDNIVGRAFFVWMNFGDLKRIGGFN
jgi:signal peptidase I